jgi:hypothetical protein
MHYSAVSLLQSRGLGPAFIKMCVVSQQCMPIEHERMTNECTLADRFEDSHTHTNVNVWIFPGVSALASASGHVLCCSASSTLVSVTSIVLRSPWPWGLENLLAPQALEVIPACTVLVRLCMLNCHATRHSNKYFHNGEFPESSPHSNGKFYNSPGCN